MVLLSAASILDPSNQPDDGGNDGNSKIALGRGSTVILLAVVVLCMGHYSTTRWTLASPYWRISVRWGTQQRHDDQHGRDFGGGKGGLKPRFEL
jgi:hypothetical protein